MLGALCYGASPGSSLPYVPAMYSAPLCRKSKMQTWQSEASSLALMCVCVCVCITLLLIHKKYKILFINNLLLLCLLLLLFSSYHLSSTLCGSMGLTLCHQSSVRGCLNFQVKRSRLRDGRSHASDHPLVSDRVGIENCGCLSESNA